MAKIEADRSSVKKEMQDATVAAAATTHDDGAKLAAGAVPTMNSAMKGNLATPGAAVLAKGSGPATTIPQQSVPQRSFAAPLARMALRLVPQHPLLPNVESGRAEGMTARPDLDWA